VTLYCSVLLFFFSVLCCSLYLCCTVSAYVVLCLLVLYCVCLCCTVSVCVVPAATLTEVFPWFFLSCKAYARA
jgi:hypothetical protein